MDKDKSCIATNCVRKEHCNGIEKCLKWKDFQYMVAHSYPGAVHPQKLQICFVDETQLRLPMLSSHGSLLCNVVLSIFGTDGFRRTPEGYLDVTPEYHMIDTKENAENKHDCKTQNEKSYYCGLTDCDAHGSCSGPQDCPKWKDVQYLIAHTSPLLVTDTELHILYHTKEYDSYSQELFGQYMEILILIIQNTFECRDAHQKVSVLVKEIN
ncbi:hypothetical protein LJC63_02045 [Ruminococcaceae bacterium OttesenSCG-928-L11]|nr:hypothetical protein [Ruminococcaceae bacterium OttesenSCG-928-L11]